MGVPGGDDLGSARRVLLPAVPAQAQAAALHRHPAALAQVPAAPILRERRLLPDGAGRCRPIPRLALQPRGRREDAVLLRAHQPLRVESAARAHRTVGRDPILLVPVPLPIRRVAWSGLAVLTAQGDPRRGVLHRLQPVHEGLPLAPPRGQAGPRAIGRVLRLPLVRGRLPGAPRIARGDSLAVATGDSPRGLRRPRGGSFRGRHSPRARPGRVAQLGHGGGVHRARPHDRLSRVHAYPGCGAEQRAAESVGGRDSALKSPAPMLESRGGIGRPHNSQSGEDQNRRNRERSPHPGRHRFRTSLARHTRARGEREHRAHDGSAGDQSEVAREVEHAGHHTALSRACTRHHGAAVGGLEDSVAGGEDDERRHVTRHTEPRRQQRQDGGAQRDGDESGDGHSLRAESINHPTRGHASKGRDQGTGGHHESDLGRAQLERAG